MPQTAQIPLSEGARRGGLLFLGLPAAGVGFAINPQLSLNGNFLVGEIGISGLQAGLPEAVRETAASQPSVSWLCWPAWPSR
jgi:hypothetical protein